MSEKNNKTQQVIKRESEQKETSHLYMERQKHQQNILYEMCRKTVENSADQSVCRNVLDDSVGVMTDAAAVLCHEQGALVQLSSL